MKRLPAGFAVLLMCSTSAQAQEQSRSLDRISIALQQPSLVIQPPATVERTPLKMGYFALVQPELPGEMVRLSVPIGELVGKAINGIAGAYRRRQIASIRRRIDGELKLLEQQRPDSPPKQH